MGKKRSKAATEGRFPDYPRKGFAKSFASFVRDSCPGWGDAARDLMREFDEERESGPHGLDDDSPLALGCRLDDIEEMDYERQRHVTKSFGKVALPTLMDQWERMPKVVRISKAAIKDVADSKEKLSQAAIDAAFPAAIFFDLSEALTKGEGRLQGLFVWSQANSRFGTVLRVCAFPTLQAGTVIEAVGESGDGRKLEFKKKAMIESFAAEKKIKQHVLSMPKASACRSSCYSLYSQETVDDMWARLEGYEPDEEAEHYDVMTGTLHQPMELVQEEPGAAWPVLWGDDKFTDGLDIAVKRLLIAAYQGVCDVEMVREGDVEVRIVRSFEEARKLKEQERAAEKVNRAHEVRLGAVKNLAAARAEIAALRRELARGSGGEASSDDVQPPLALEEGDDGEHLADEFEALRLELEQTRNRWDADRAELEAELSKAKLEAERQKERADVERARADVLDARASLIDSLELPLTCAGALSLAERAWPDRLLFLPSAKRSVEQFNPKRADEVFDVLRAMALHLHALAFSGDSVDVTRAFRAQSGYEVAMRDVRQVRKSPQLRRARTFSYEGKRIEMIPHVKGTSNKPGECLRVHFLLDHEKQLIVIGHCGEHLSGEMSPR